MSVCVPRLCRSSAAVSSVLLWLLCLFASATGQEAKGSQPARLDDGSERLLLLANGQVIRGHVAQEGDRYVVSVPRAELRIPRRDVEFVCRTLEEGFRLKRANVVDNNCNDHLRLAQWCLAQGLLDDAEAEMGRAADLEPHHPRLELMRRELKLAREPVRPAAAPTEVVEPPVQDAQLDSMVRALPATAVETYAQTVQPLLLNHCAAAGCHGPDTRSQFQLLRLARGETPTRRVTQRNLHAVLEWVDQQEPDRSRLLAAAREAHGGATGPSFKSTDAAAYRHLAAWVQQLTAPLPSGPPETVEATGNTLSQSIAPAAISPPARMSRSPLLPTPSLHTVGNPAGDRGPSQAARGIRPPEVQPPAAAEDPFDPQVFNRRYHPQSGSVSPQNQQPRAVDGATDQRK